MSDLFDTPTGDEEARLRAAGWVPVHYAGATAWRSPDGKSLYHHLADALAEQARREVAGKENP